MLKRIVMTILLAIVGVGLIVKAPAAHTLPAAMTVWTQDTANKVQPTTAPGSGNTIVLEGARASYEAYQIIVHAGTGGLTGVNVSTSALSDGMGHVIPASN